MTGSATSTTTDAQRDEVLRRYRVHDLGPRRQLQALADLAALVCDVPMAAINLIGTTDQHRVATVGIERQVCSSHDTMCSVSMSQAQPVLVPDARLDARFRDNAYVTGERATIRFYASHQLRTPNGVVFGTICVFDGQPRRLTEGQFKALGTLAEQVVDVLELELISVQLTQANDRLATSNERLDDFAGQVSHDLQNPLGAISTSLRMAQDVTTRAPGPHQTQLTGLLSNAGRCADRMTVLIDNLLQYARSGASPARSPVDLRVVVETVLEDLHDMTAGYTITMSGLPTLEADEVQMRVLLQNLVGNALKFTSDVEHPAVWVRGRRTDAGWRIEVLDNGPGIRETDRERVFDLFARSNESEPGSGIGLSTCRKIVEAHRGRIGVTESPTGGTLVWFDLPALVADSSDRPAGGAGARSATKTLQATA